MSSKLDLATEKMRAAHVSPSAIAAFEHAYRALESGATGLIPEDTIDPVADVMKSADISVTAEQANAALAKVAMIRLNGGLGTSMGLEKAKTLLQARQGKTFLELIVEQVLHVRATTGARLPLIFMNSFRTREDCRAELAKYPNLEVPGIPLDFLQNAVPKIDAQTLEPASWPAEPELEWCPPGHGDIYTTLVDSGLLEALLESGFKYLFIANGDNLGAWPSAEIAAWFAESGAPFMTEVTPRTPADLKGGHLARRKSDGQLILRETAQTPPEEMTFFTDASRHPYAHCNNLWFAVEPLLERLKDSDGVLGLPLIRNEKTVDPRDPSSPAVYQLETAMGAAVERFPGAIALEVGRDRFIPVKTTNDLLVLRSDVYELGEDRIPKLTVDKAPLVSLDKKYFGRISDFEARFPGGVPSLREAEQLEVAGDWRFGANVTVKGKVTLAADGCPCEVSEDSVLA